MRWLQDLKFATRRLRKTPLVTTAAIATLGLGTGSIVAMMTLLDALAFRALPVPEPREVVAVSIEAGSSGSSAAPLSAWAEMSRRQTVFAGMSPFFGNGTLITVVGGELSRSRFDAVSGDYFRLLGVRPLLGRLITPEDVALDGGLPAPVAVISHDFWQRNYAGDAQVIGHVLQAEGVVFTIIGVTPREFLGLEVGSSTDVTVPITVVPQIVGLPADSPLQVARAIARLHPGVRAEHAEAHIAAFWPAVAATSAPPGYTAQQRIDLAARRVTVSSAFTGFSNLRNRYVTPLFILVAFTGTLLLITCANLTTVLTARAARRQQEFAVRLALGASRGGLMRDVFMESLVVAVAGTSLGAVLSSWGVLALLRLLPEATPIVLDVSPSSVTLAMTVAVVLITWLGVGCGPAAAVINCSEAGSLRASRSVTGHSMRLNKLLSGSQVALSFVLLSFAGLLTKSFLDLRHRDYGFREEGVAVAQLLPQPNGYASINDESYYPALLEKLSQLPGVERAALSLPMPALGADSEPKHTVGLSSSRSEDNRLAAVLVAVSPGFFATLDVALPSGRDFTWRDNLDTPRVAIVSASLARRLSGQSIVDHHIDVGVDARRQRLLIVGIAADASITNVRSLEPLVVYVPALQEPPPYARWPALLIRSTVESSALIPPVRRAIESFGHEYVGSTRSLERQIGMSLGRERMIASLSVFFAVLAALLASLGLYGMLSYTVAQRTRECGIRQALGASRLEIGASLMKQGLTVTLVGLGTGAFWATLAAAQARSYGLGPDPFVFAAAGTLLLCVAAGAALGPAIRAARVAPARALQAE